MLKIVTDLHEWRLIRESILHKSIGFVPTMGNLHAGHISLCEQSLSQNEVTVVSVFVNPTQFNQRDDFEKYPRTIDADVALLEKVGVQYLLLPTESALYSDGYQVQVIESDISATLEGEFRPGHFSGVLTVVNKLFNLVQPTKAYFGEKDFQQLLLIQKMVSALMMSIEIIGCETLRDTDDLALSSRNSRLSEEARQKAALLPNVLKSDMTLDKMHQTLEASGFKVEYIAEKWGRRLAAVWLDQVRLIDNIKI